MPRAALILLCRVGYYAAWPKLEWLFKGVSGRLEQMCSA